MNSAFSFESQKWDSGSEAMSTAECLSGDRPRPPCVAPAENLPHWYALRTQPRHEKKVATHLQQKAVPLFLPLLTEIHRWSDRRKTVRLPLFPGYVFVRVGTENDERLAVLRTGGVISFVGFGGCPAPIPDKQIEDIQKLLAHDVPCALFPFLREGQRVRIRGGCLDGLEGLLVSRHADRSLVISLGAIQQSLALRIEGYDVEILAPPGLSGPV